MTRPAYVIGVDVGGTFTDVFILDESTGQVFTAKVPSTRGDQSKGFVEGIASRNGYRVAQLPMSLFDLSQDVGEQHNVLAENPAVVARLQAHAELYRQELGDSLTGITGSGVREIGRNDR